MWEQSYGLYTLNLADLIRLYLHKDERRNGYRLVVLSNALRIHHDQCIAEYFPDIETAKRYAVEIARSLLLKALHQTDQLLED